MTLEMPPGRLLPRRVTVCVFAWILAVFAVRNLPWHLDDYDQAKQAFVSFEMIETGAWWFQHTPSGRIATKPPLAGWISAALYGAMGGHGWEIVWRLPSFASALALAAWLWRTGRRLAGEMAGLIAMAAFALNLTAPRLATLVRTDMMLTLCIYGSGWLILEKIRNGTDWSRRDCWILGLTVLASMLTKGPIVYAFLLPGLAAFLWLTRRSSPAKFAWSGWLSWCVPLLIFTAWVGIGVWLSREFFQQVVLREFLGRFDLSDAPVHKHQPVWFYLAHLFHKWAPWSVALLALCCTRRARQAIRSEPALLWLACWAAGGFVFMSLVPSKRPDRIFPLIPPLCLLLGVLAQRRIAAGESTRRTRLTAGVMGLGAVISGGHAIGHAIADFRSDQRALVRFGERARTLAAAHPERLAVVAANDEGLLLYTGRTRFTHMDEAVQAWQRGELDWMLLRERDLDQRARELGEFTRALELPKVEQKHGPYFLIRRSAIDSHE